MTCHTPWWSFLFSLQVQLVARHMAPPKRGLCVFQHLKICQRIPLRLERYTPIQPRQRQWLPLSIRLSHLFSYSNNLAYRAYLGSSWCGRFLSMIFTTLTLFHVPIPFIFLVTLIYTYAYRGGGFCTLKLELWQSDDCHSWHEYLLNRATVSHLRYRLN